MFRTSGNGEIGFLGQPLRLDVENLEVVSGSGGVFFDVGNVNIGGVSEDVDGIATSGGDVHIKSTGDVTLNETISTSEQGNGGAINLDADNDITINERIETDSYVELKAGRSININEDIDTSNGDGDIDLFGNNNEINLANRSDGKGSINQLDGTTLNAGSGRINIELGSLGKVGDINLGNLRSTAVSYTHLTLPTMLWV